MPPQKERLHKGDFAQLGSRTTLRSPLFDLVYTGASSFKIACIISKKRISRAVDRNRIRRKTYHAWKATGFSKPYVVIIYPRKEALRVPFARCVDELSSLFATLH